MPQKQVASHKAMISNLDMYRSAKLLIDQHGDGTAIEAAMGADSMLDKGNLDGATGGCHGGLV